MGKRGFSSVVIIVFFLVFLAAAGIGGGLYWKQHLQNLCGLQPPLICGVDNKLICLEGKWRCEKAEEFKKDNQYSSSEAASDAANVEKLPSENDISAWKTYPSTSSGQADILEWKLYRNEKYGFEVKHPAEWTVWPFGFGADVRMASTLYESRAHGSGDPSGIWINFFVIGSSSLAGDRCFDTNDKFVQTADPPGQMVKIVCHNNFGVEANYWRGDALSKENETVLNAIMSTFKFIE